MHKKNKSARNTHTSMTKVYEILPQSRQKYRKYSHNHDKSTGNTHNHDKSTRNTGNIMQSPLCCGVYASPGLYWHPKFPVVGSTPRPSVLKKQFTCRCQRYLLGVTLNNVWPLKICHGFFLKEKPNPLKQAKNPKKVGNV